MHVRHCAMVSRVRRDAARKLALALRKKERARAKKVQTARIREAVRNLRRFCVVRAVARDGYTKISVQRVRAFLRAEHVQQAAGRPITIPTIRLVTEVMKQHKLFNLYSSWVHVGGRHVPRWFTRL